MKTITLLLASALCAGAATAQGTFSLPAAPTMTTNNLPIGGGVIRYQQWISGPEWVAALGEPQRVVSMSLSPGPLATTTTTIEVEVAMGHGNSFGPLSFFDGNFTDTRVVVFPKTTIMVNAGSATTFNFVPANYFQWDGQSAVVIDIKIFSNGQQSQPFQHENVSTTTATGKSTRLYTIGNASASNASFVQSGWGLIMTFTTIQGALLDFGQGCPGAGGFVPEAAIVSGVPSPGSLLQTEVQKVSPANIAVWTVGGDRTTFGGLSLPLDLGIYGASGCFLLNDLVLTRWTVSGGGGVGGSIASVQAAVPAITPLIGTHWFAQWFVFDANAPNGLLAASQGNWFIIAP